jgi:hypothetical protein
MGLTHRYPLINGAFSLPKVERWDVIEIDVLGKIQRSCRSESVAGISASDGAVTSRAAGQHTCFACSKIPGLAQRDRIPLTSRKTEYNDEYGGYCRQDEY